ncbi:hypothetical protein NDN16_20225 [Aureimonas altamirensis]|uniref:hypothetical protein n=1 Tax=Aureimonas altamirensis TaxID=370622 RepID=UPI002036AF76|nr:hypothetical protein [Aureimonas altamirensis]MCM2505991.1 hypothetical protein [Aureimonas altamirensis]
MTRIHKSVADRYALICALAVLIIYTIILLHKPWALITTFAHDDALYTGIARSLLDGEWLGTYNDRILAKPPGFSFFIAATSVVGLPFHIAVAIFNAAATAFLAWSVLRLTDSRVATVAVFALVLLSPQYFMLDRVLRETIYPAQVCLFLGIIIFWMTSKTNLRWGAASGLTFGWLWITREDGIWLIPGVLMTLTLAEKSVAAKLKTSLAFGTAFAIIILSLGYLNYSYYGRWTIAEIKDPTFVGMISATQSVSGDSPIPGVAVPRATRARLYEVSPRFATLRPFLDSPHFFDFACAQTPERCGEIGNGWWHWAVRYAAWQSGIHKSAGEAAEFYDQVRLDIETACEDGRLSCHRRIVKSLPTMSIEDVWQMPSYMLRLLRNVFLIDRIVLTPELSGGAEPALSNMYGTLQRPPTFQSPEFISTFLIDREAYQAGSVATFVQYVVDIYRFAFIAILLLVVMAATRRLFEFRTPRFNTVERIVLISLVFAGTRLALLAIVGTTSFSTSNAVYLGPVYHLTAFTMILFAYWIGSGGDSST